MNEEKVRSMFDFRTKHHKKIKEENIASYKKLYYKLKELQESGELETSKDYLCGNELAIDIYNKKYFLKDLDGNVIEKTPEDAFRRMASYLACVEKEENQVKYAKRFYNILYNGYFMPGGRVLAGAGDLFRLKTLANCFVTVIKEDNIESIYNAAYDCARTYSYGGGIGVDISSLRPKDSVVHNAADKSTGAVSFMELYSMTTGLIGQSGRRGALMITLDVKHPDVIDFIKVKKKSNWITNQIVDQCTWSGKFSEEQLEEIRKQVRENTQVRFANISLKVSDEFMNAVDETKKYKKNSLLLYKKLNKEKVMRAVQNNGIHYSYKIPSKVLSEYEFVKEFKTLEELNNHLKENISKEDLKDPEKRDIYGDIVIETDEEYDFAVHKTGDFLTYFGSDNTDDIKHLVDAEDIWEAFVSGNYTTAEPGLIFWDTMVKYSPSEHLGIKISSTNPCGEVPIEDGGACNLGSINLSRLVKNGYEDNAEIDWETMKETIFDTVRFLDNVIDWNIALNPLEKQRLAAKNTRRLGIGLMGIADMLNQLGINYDSEEGIKLVEKITKFLAENCYIASANLAKEKEPIPLWDYEKYSKGPFFNERLSDEIKELIKNNGLRNIALTSIAPTGTISNIVLSYKNENKNYIGVSGGIEPIFALYYTRRSEQMNEGAFYNVFHSTVQAFIDKNNLQEQTKNVTKVEELKKTIPSFFFRTSHFINADSRIETQAACQKFIDHSISSTINLPESVEPEAISNIYLKSWKRGLKGITIYRDGSRFPILSVEQEVSEFQKVKDKTFSVSINGEKKVMRNDTVFKIGNRFTTPFHAKNLGIDIEETKETLVSKKEKNGFEEKGKACKIKFKDGKLVKDCGD